MFLYVDARFLYLTPNLDRHNTTWYDRLSGEELLFSSMKFILASFLLTISFWVQAQKQIELQDVSKHIGDSVIVGGKVYGSKSINGGKLLLINIGGPFPNQPLTIVLNEELQKVLHEPLKSELQQLKVAGKIELFRDKPQIVLTSPEQIQSLITEKSGTKDQ